MKAIIEDIDRLAATLKKLQPLKPEYQLRLDKKIRLEFSYNSNHIEGNTLTYGETELLLIFDKTTGNHELREYEEMKSHDVAFEMIKEWATDKERPLTEMIIKNLHEVLLLRPFWKEALTPDGQPTRRLIKVGDYKEYPNHVRLQNGEMFHYTSPENTPIEMGELVQWYRDEEEKNELHPVVLAALLHYKFVRIHPFDDGNGRISRLLMNYVFLKHSLQPVVIKSEDKKNYLFALNQADVGDMDAFVDYIAAQILWSLDISIKAAKGEKIDEHEDLDKEIHLLQRELRGDDVLSLARTSGNICDAIEMNIFPLFMLMEEKLQGFKQSFFDASRRIDFETEGESGTRSVGTINSQWKELKQNWLEKQVRVEGKILHKLRYSYELKGFRKNIAANSFWMTVEVNFLEYNYAIQTYSNRNNPETIPYGKELTIAALQDIIAPTIKDMLENIKRLNASGK